MEWEYVNVIRSGIKQSDAEFIAADLRSAGIPARAEECVDLAAGRGPTGAQVGYQVAVPGEYTDAARTALGLTGHDRADGPGGVERSTVVALLVVALAVILLLALKGLL